MSESEVEADEIRRLTAKARLLANERRLDEALALMDRATDLRLAPLQNRLAAWRFKHFILYTMGRYRDALPVAEKVIAWDPTAAIGYIQRAEDLSMLDRHEEALASAERAVELEPQSSGPWRRKGYTLYLATRYNEALQAQSQAIILDPQNTTARIDLALTLEAMGRYKDAIAASEEALRIIREIESSPVGTASSRNEQVRVLAIEARSLHALKRWPEALAASETALALAPERVDMWSVRFAALDLLKRPEEALAAAKRVVELAPTAVVRWKNVISLLLRLKRYEEALSTVERVLEFAPSDAELHTYRAVLVAQFVAQGKLPHTALINIEGDLDDPEIWIMTARNLIFLKDHEAALRASEEGLRRFPTKIELYSTKMRALIGLHHFRETVATFLEGLRFAKLNPVFGHEFSEPKSKPTSESQ